MLPGQRRALVLEQVSRAGAARVTDIAESLGVSEMTIRRDLQELDRGGLLRRVHGGATAITRRTSHEPGFAAKSGLERRAKLAIARHAARLVEPGMTIAISAGTTTHAFAEQILAVPGLTVVTNSTDAANLLQDKGVGTQVVLTGGVRTPSHALVGPIAVSALHQLRVDAVFHGVHGFDIDAGLTCPNLDECATAQAMIAAGKRLVILADSTKCGTVGLAQVAPLAEVDLFVTDDGLDAADEQALRERVTSLAVVPVEG